MNTKEATLYPLNTKIQSSSIDKIKEDSRVLFIDNLRMSLTVLVVLHHLILSFLLNNFTGNSIQGPMQSIGSAIVGLNQAFFMGLFFLLSSYFVPPAYDKKGAVRFLYDRFLRLFIPLIIYTFGLSQVAAISTYVVDHVPFNWHSYISNVLVAHMWFVEMLLIFVCIYAVWRKLTRHKDLPIVKNEKFPNYAAIGIFVLALTVCSFIIRLWIPLGNIMTIGSPEVIKIILFFTPSGYDLPQYIGLFIVGIIAYRRNWFVNIPDSMGRVGMGMIIGSTIFLLPLAMFFGIKGMKFAGGLTWTSFVYCLWESLFCVGMCLWLITFFRRRFDKQGRVCSFLSKHAYVVYIIHIPIISCVAIPLNKMHISSDLRFLLATIITLPICFLLGYFIRKLPIASRIL